MIKGSHHTEETKRQLSRILTGKEPTSGSFEKGSIPWNKGKDRTQETKRKISKALMDRKRLPFTDETRRRMSEARKGKSLSEETKNKIRDANIGKHHSEETRKKMSNNWMGNKNPHWKGGITSETNARTSKPAWKTLAHKIRKRDNHWCLYCRDTRGEVVHHMLPDRLGGTDDETNLVTLCRPCHHFIESKIVAS